MAKTWKYRVGDNTITVVNTLGGSELIVNGQLQDKKNGVALRDDLQGKLPSGENVKASVGGLVTMQCTLFVDNVLQTATNAN